MKTPDPFPASSGSIVARLRSSLGLERNMLVLHVSLLILGMGEELWVRYVPKYLELLGASVFSIGIYGTLKDLLDALYQYPGGWITDRLGRRSALMLFALLALFGYGIYLVSPNWTWVLLGTIFVMAWSSLTLPTIFAIIGDSLPTSRRAIGFGVQSLLKRLPIVIAPPIGAWLIAVWGLHIGIRIGLVITLCLAVIAIGIVGYAYVEPRKVETHSDDAQLTHLWRSMDGYLKRLLVADCLVRWAEGLPKVFLLLYVVNIAGGTMADFGWLTSLQMLTATLIYLPIAKLSDGLDRKPFVLLTFVCFTLFPLLVVQAGSLAWMALAFVFAGLREIGEPARKALIVDLAMSEARGRIVGLYYLVRGLVVFPAALVGGWLWSIHPTLPFYAAGAVGLVACVVYGLWGPNHRPTAERFT